MSSVTDTYRDCRNRLNFPQGLEVFTVTSLGVLKPTTATDFDPKFLLTTHVTQAGHACAVLQVTASPSAHKLNVLQVHLLLTDFWLHYKPWAEKE